MRILPEELSAGSQEFYQRSPALSLEEPQQALAWLPVLAAPLLLMAVLGALSLGCYMCVWRHPRLCFKSSTEEGLRHTAVLGPLRILPEELSAGSQEFYQRSPALSLEEPQQAVAWLPVLAAPLLLMAVLGALSLGCYMCVWRHPRLCFKSSSKLLVPIPTDEMHTAVGTVFSTSPARQF
ncbi:UNVERIFIED_CONTAM: hypothetical protein FKN15_001345 [Acipenser sinensis]